MNRALIILALIFIPFLALLSIAWHMILGVIPLGGPTYEALYASSGLASLLLFFISIPVVLGLLVFYIAHICQNPFIPEQQRTAWIVVLFIIPFVVIPVYWARHIWKKDVASEVYLGSDLDHCESETS